MTRSLMLLISRSKQDFTQTKTLMLNHFTMSKPKIETSPQRAVPSILVEALPRAGRVAEKGWNKARKQADPSGFPQAGE